jgi:hypothetical protein
MAGILDLPNELLLNIADRLRHDGLMSRTYSRKHKDLRQLALTCRQLLPIAQDALYSDAFIGTTRSAQNGPTRIARFARTLLKRPDLASKVKVLRLKTTSDPPAHSRTCVRSPFAMDDCDCGWKEIVDLCRTFLETTKTETGLSLLDRSWINWLEQRHEPALAGIILFLTPAVRTLTLELQNKGSGRGMDGHRRVFDAEHIELRQLFGTLPEHPEFAIEQVLGLNNVTKLYTAGWVPSSIIALPRLEASKLSLLNHRYSNAPLHLKRHSGLGGLTLSTTLKRLTVRLDVSIAYSAVAPGPNTMHTHLGTTMKGLTSLTHLYLQLTSSFEHSDIYLPPGTWDKVILTLESNSLLHLMMDASDVDDSIEDYESYEAVVDSMRPITTLTRLPRLRKLCAPQSAFFSIDHDFEKCDLPMTIETIGIINPSKAANRYAEHILENREKWPHLSIIRLWMDGRHLEREPRLMEDSYEEEDDEWKEDFNVSNSIWKEMKSSGIKTKRMRGREGWRKGSMGRR